MDLCGRWDYGKRLFQAAQNKRNLEKTGWKGDFATPPYETEITREEFYALREKATKEVSLKMRRASYSMLNEHRNPENYDIWCLLPDGSVAKERRGKFFVTAPNAKSYYPDEVWK